MDCQNNHANLSSALSYSKKNMSVGCDSCMLILHRCHHISGVIRLAIPLAYGISGHQSCDGNLITTSPMNFAPGGLRPRNEVDTETGEVTLLDYAAAVDCGTPINPNLTRVQAEGGIAQGVGMTLTESVTYDDRGYPMENSLFQYKIPARVDIGKIRVEFENSYEGEGPFGAKSIGEVVINTPLPAISDAIRNAVGKRFYELPITPEKIAMAALEKK